MDVKIIDDGKEIRVFLDGKRMRRSFKCESSRPIFYSKEFVVKLDELSGYMNQCSSERKIWKTLKNKEHSKYFVPTLKYGKQAGWEYVVQPRIHFKKLSVKEHPELDYLLNILSEKGLDDFQEGNNIGITKDKKLVCYDYGC